MANRLLGDLAKFANFESLNEELIKSMQDFEKEAFETWRDEVIFKIEFNLYLLFFTKTSGSLSQLLFNPSQLAANHASFVCIPGNALAFSLGACHNHFHLRCQNLFSNDRDVPQKSFCYCMLSSTHHQRCFYLLWIR